MGCYALFLSILELLFPSVNRIDDLSILGKGGTGKFEKNHLPPTSQSGLFKIDLLVQLLTTNDPPRDSGGIDDVCQFARESPLFMSSGASRNDGRIVISYQ